MTAKHVLVAALVVAGCSGKKRASGDLAHGSGSGAPVAPPAEVATVADAAPDAPLPGRPERAVWHLVDNRHTAHRAVDGELVIDARTASFARYTRFGLPALRWKLGASVAGARAAIADKVATIEVPLIPEQPRPAQITARVWAAGDRQALAVKVNGRSAGRVDKVALEPGWQTIAIPIATDRFAPGENQVALETVGRGKDRIALAWLRAGTLHPPADQDPLAAATFDAAARAIELAEHASLTWYVPLPDGAHLVADVAPPCQVEVGARAADASYAGGLLAADQGRVDLSAMAGKVVRLSISARDCPRARLLDPRITVHGPEPAPLPAAAPPRYVLLWVWDASRADKLALFSPGARAQTPNLDELATSSAVFRQYYVQGNESQTSHSSMWTGLYPAVHGVRMAGQGGTHRLEPQLAVIGEVLSAAGLYTAAVTGNGYVTDGGGYTRGFREFRNMMREAGVRNGVLYGERIVDAALARLEDRVSAHRDQPVFLFFGTVDAHAPWIARKPWIDVYSPGRYDGPFQQFAGGANLGFEPGRMGCGFIPPPADVERLRAIYDSAISYQDAQLGRVIARLKSLGIWDQTLLVITADHGEELFEDGRCGHGGSLRDSLVRVPLLVRDPARFPGGTIVEEGAEGVDLLPTVLDALGAPRLPAAQGASLVPLAQGIGRGWPRPSYASMYEYAHAMRIGRWKARVGPTGVPIVSDLVADPGETRDLAAQRPIERRMLTDSLGLFLALRTRWHKATWGVVTNTTAAGAAVIDEVAVP